MKMDIFVPTLGIAVVVTFLLIFLPLKISQKIKILKKKLLLIIKKRIIMPCSDGGSLPNSFAVIDTKKIDKLTRLLCGLCRNLSRDGLERYIRWEQHQQEIDKERLKREKKEWQKRLVKKQALAKLSPEERKALNLE